MTAFPRPLTALARERNGLLTAADLSAHGLVGRRRQRLLRDGELIPVHRGVYRLASHPVTFEQRCRAACLAAPHAAISGPTAARLLGLRKVRTEEIHLLARQTIHLDGVTAHRTDLLAPSDICDRDGVRVLRPARLVCDLSSHLDEAALESVLEQMLERRLVSLTTVRAAARRYYEPGRAGSIRLARVLDSRDVWLRPVESDLELRVWRALANRGVTCERQYPIELDSGAKIRVDLALPSIRLAIEVDHVTWHGGRLDMQRDKRRDRELARMGWTSVRVTDADVTSRFDSTIDDLIEIARRC